MQRDALTRGEALPALEPEGDVLAEGARLRVADTEDVTSSVALNDAAADAEPRPEALATAVPREDKLLVVATLTEVAAVAEALFSRDAVARELREGAAGAVDDAFWDALIVTDAHLLGLRDNTAPRDRVADAEVL